MGQDDRDTTRGHFRSRCSIARTLDIFGDKWTLLIVRDLLWHGKHTFGALHESAERIPTNILSDRLRRLETWGLVERRPYADRPPRHEYHLTARGRSLEDALLGVMAWGACAPGRRLLRSAHRLEHAAAQPGFQRRQRLTAVRRGGRPAPIAKTFGLAGEIR